MVVSKKILVTAGIITIGIFILIYSLNIYLNFQRERAVLENMENILDEYQELQALTLMSNVFGKNMSCLSLENSLLHMDKTLWDTGVRIDKYREATEKFITDPFYIKQKEKFNRNEVIYFTMLQNLKQRCDFNQVTILYFYKKKEFCPNCDAQAFVLTDLNKEIDPEVAIFSFDSDLGLSSIKTLEEFYEISNYPCIVIEGNTYCGLHNKKELVNRICDYRNISLCST